MTGAVRLARITGVLLLGLASAQGCGPDFRADVFVRVNRPDRPAEYPKGKLGLLQPTFARADLLVAYRYLSGGTLDAEEQKGWQPTYDDDEPEWEIEAQQRAAGNYGRDVIPDTPIGRWVLARKDYPDAPPGSISQFRVMRVPVGSGSYEVDYLNCGDDAFRTATLTLADRAARWGKASAPLKDWLRAQDAVFSNCKDGRIIPEAATAGSPALLVADRAYQTAAAEFYSGNYSAARAQFAAIGKDGASPWQPLGGYVAARVLLRQAFSQALDPSKEVNEYDPALMKQAREALRAYLATAPAPPPNLQKAAGALLNLVRIRTEPEVRVRELGALVGGSGASHDPNYQQDATDLLWYVNAKTPEGLRAQPNGRRRRRRLPPQHWSVGMTRTRRPRRSGRCRRWLTGRSPLSRSILRRERMLWPSGGVRTPCRGWWRRSRLRPRVESRPTCWRRPRRCRRTHPGGRRPPTTGYACCSVSEGRRRLGRCSAQ